MDKVIFMYSDLVSKNESKPALIFQNIFRKLMTLINRPNVFWKYILMPIL